MISVPTRITGSSDVISDILVEVKKEHALIYSCCHISQKKCDSSMITQLISYFIKNSPAQYLDLLPSTSSIIQHNHHHATNCTIITHIIQRRTTKRGTWSPCRILQPLLLHTLTCYLQPMVSWEINMFHRARAGPLASFFQQPCNYPQILSLYHAVR